MIIPVKMIFSALKLYYCLQIIGVRLEYLSLSYLYQE